MLEAQVLCVFFLEILGRYKCSKKPPPPTHTHTLKKYLKREATDRRNDSFECPSDNKSQNDLFVPDPMKN